jgi:hypothetical protein
VKDYTVVFYSDVIDGPILISVPEFRGLSEREIVDERMGPVAPDMGRISVCKVPVATCQRGFQVQGTAIFKDPVGLVHERYKALQMFYNVDGYNLIELAIIERPWGPIQVVYFVHTGERQDIEGGFPFLLLMVRAAAYYEFIHDILSLGNSGLLFWVPADCPAVPMIYSIMFAFLTDPQHVQYFSLR